MTNPVSAAELAPCKHCGKYHAQEVLRCPASDCLLDLRGRLVDGKFRMVKRLGIGGMAEIWLARNESVDRRVAIKLLRPEVERSEENLARFQTEARAAGRIRSRYVCEVVDFGQCAAGPYIVMQWLRGRDLAEWVEDEGRLDVGDAVWVVRRALLGLADAHGAGVLHRDLKPSNIFIHQEDSGELVVKLMDFGVARFMDGREGEHTHAGAILGTPEYMAPEQLVAPAGVDERADIWAIGAVLYRVITGERVFSGDGIESLLHAVVAQPVLPIRKLAPTLPKELAALIDRCLSRDAAARPESASILFDLLAPFERSPSGPFRVVEPTYSIGGGFRRPPTGISEVLAGAAPTGPRSRTGLARDIGLSFVGVALLVTLWAKCRPQDEPAQLVVPGRAGEDPAAEPVALAGAATSRASMKHEVEASVGDAAKVSGSHPKQARAHHVTGKESANGHDLIDLPDVGAGAAVRSAGQSEKDSAKTLSTADVAEQAVVVQPKIDAAQGEVARPGTLEIGGFLVLTEKSPMMGQWQAKEYCKELAEAGHLGVYDWHLPNPAEMGKVANQGGVRRGRYWSSAAWRGKAKAYFLPSGRSLSLKTTRGFVRPLCIARAR